ncbi:MAG: hypothetical protein FWF33_03585 [Clostridiales bacterium]|nr:hypothetical protein [Clostridiales bacterium]
MKQELLSHAMIVAGGTPEERGRTANGILKTHFADDAEAARKIDAGIFEDLLFLYRAEEKAEITVDQIASLIEFLARRPFASTGRAAVIEDADRMNTAAQNKLLKQLEEPAPGVVILLLTSAPARLLPTVRSRCTLRWLGYAKPGLPSAAAAEDIRELVRLLLFEKGTLPDAWALCAGYEKDRSDTLAFLDTLSFFLRDLAAGSLDAALLPADSLTTPEASARMGAKYRGACLRCMPAVERAIGRAENGDSCKTALREMALTMKMETASEKLMQKGYM